MFSSVGVAGLSDQDWDDARMPVKGASATLFPKGKGGDWDNARMTKMELPKWAGNHCFFSSSMASSTLGGPGWMIWLATWMIFHREAIIHPIERSVRLERVHYTGSPSQECTSGISEWMPFIRMRISFQCRAFHYRCIDYSYLEANRVQRAQSKRLMLQIVQVLPAHNAQMAACTAVLA